MVHDILSSCRGGFLQTHQIVADFQQISARCQSFQFNKRGFPSSLVFEEVEIDANPPARRRASRVLNFQMQLKAWWSIGEILLGEFCENSFHWSNSVTDLVMCDHPTRFQVYQIDQISEFATWLSSLCRLFWYVVWSPAPVLVAISRHGFCEHSMSVNRGWFTTLPYQMIVDRIISNGRWFRWLVRSVGNEWEWESGWLPIFTQYHSYSFGDVMTRIPYHNAQLRVMTSKLSTDPGLHWTELKQSARLMCATKSQWNWGHFHMGSNTLYK